MQKVITINLNGHAYQLEEGGYEAIRAYLDTAARELEGNPDLAEIMADLEQAIADKCRRFLSPQKSVVTAAEVEQIVAEMGPIDATPGETGQSHEAHTAGEPGKDATGAAAEKRLYRITEGAMLAGVCQGLAAYTGYDVNIVRLAFVMTAFFSGVGILAYLVLMFVMPEAKTPEQKAAAGGVPFNAQEVVDRVKQEYTAGTRRLRRHWRHQQRQWRRTGAPVAAAAYAPSRVGVALLPVFGLIHLVLFLVMAAMVISLVNSGQILGRELPEDVPLWAGVLGLLVVYQIFVSPIRAAAQWSQPQPGAYAFWNTAFSLVAVGIILWAASQHPVEIREFMQEVPRLFRDFMHAVRDFLTSN